MNYKSMSLHIRKYTASSDISFSVFEHMDAGFAMPLTMIWGRLATFCNGCVYEKSIWMIKWGTKRTCAVAMASFVRIDDLLGNSALKWLR